MRDLDVSGSVLSLTTPFPSPLFLSGSYPSHRGLWRTACAGRQEGGRRGLNAWFPSAGCEG